MKNKLTILALVGVLVLGYWTHRLWKFAKASEHYFAYVSSAIDCLIQEDGQNQTDIDILFRGYKSRQAFADAANKQYPGLYPKDSPLLVRKTYDDQIKECHDFYSHYRCWMLDPHDPASLDGCGEHFGLNKQEIEIMKKDPSKINQVMDAMWERRKKEE